jgi:hypothetical protein
MQFKTVVCIVAFSYMSFADTGLTGQPWLLQSFRQASGRTTVPNPSNYTVNFKNDGAVSAKADCNIAKIPAHRSSPSPLWRARKWRAARIQKAIFLPVC